MSAGFIYEGAVRHRRLAVRAHEFRYRLAMLYVDVDRAPELLGGSLCSERPGVVRLRRRDYLGEPEVTLSSAVRSLVRERTGLAADGPVWLLTQPRTFGVCFNPISFYFCWDGRDQLVAVVAEVTNTPWGERHAYVLRSSADGIVDGELAKALHVSPFMGMDQRYRLRVSAPDVTVSAHIENLQAGHRIFDATLSLRRLALTRSSLRRMVWRSRLGALRVLALIYAHAVVLKLKGVPVHRHPRLT